MISSAIAFCAPIASIVTMPPRTSIFSSSSGIAVISLDFSWQTCWPSASPDSPAQAVTTCRAPSSFVASWLRRAVLPSKEMIGRSTPVSAMASSRRWAIQALKAASKAAGLSSIRTRRKTSLPGMPGGQVEDAGEEFLLELGPAGDGGGPGGAGQDGQDGDDQDAGQGMLAIDVRAGVLEGGEGGHDLVQLGAVARQRRPPATGCGSRHGRR